MAERAPESVILIAAPSGFGKSVLAAQIVRHLGLNDVLWVNLPDEDGSERLLAEAVSGALGPRFARQHDSESEPDEDDATVLSAALSRFTSRPAALVLDNAWSGEELTVLLQAATDFLRVSCSSSRVILCGRELSPALDGGFPVLRISGDDLRLEFEEAAEVAAAITGGQPTDAEIAELLAATAGHVASFLVVSRYVALHGIAALRSGAAPTSLRASLRAVAGGQLGVRERQALFACAILGWGDDGDLTRVLESPGNIAEVAQSVPLVMLRAAEEGGFLFNCHDQVVSSFVSHAWAQESVPGADGVVGQCLDVLHGRGDLARAVRVVAELRPDALGPWLEEHGRELLNRGFIACLDRAVARLPVGWLVSKPRLLLLQASVHSARLDHDEAERKARVALELARHADDFKAQVEALSLIESALYARGDLSASHACLESILATAGTSVELDDELLLRSKLAMTAAQLGDRPGLQEQKVRVETLLCRADASSYSRVRAEIRLATAALGLPGNVLDGIRQLSPVLERTQLPVSLEVECLANVAAALAQVGRLHRSEQALSRAERLIDDHCLHFLHPLLMATRCCIAAARGLFDDARAASDEVLGPITSRGDSLNANYHRLHRAIIVSAAGERDAALAEVEHALEYFAASGITAFLWQAVLELALCLATLGDPALSREHCVRIRPAILAADYPYHLLLADLILAEADRIEGLTDDGIERLSGQREYILSENANWTTAMIIRVLPGLLGMLAQAVSPQRLPLHMLRMVGDDKLDEGLRLAEEWIDPERAAALRHHARHARLRPEEPGRGAYEGCYVRLFGSLEVRTPEVGLVGDADWKKRKARMMFAMLVARRGQDVPRDVLFEYLWPDMDEERARNNYYVVLSAIKRATLGQASRGRSPYINVNGAMCSIDTANVRSDLDDFDETLAAARSCDESGDPDGAVKAYARLMDTYRGDLLPGDLYDDWFAPMRERYRQEFSDAMLAGSALMTARGDVNGALHMLRRALMFDPWREDLYQASLRLQISSGQRSAAVETYVACKSRLGADLGLDPSVETRKLYETILAMEDDAEFV